LETPAFRKEMESRTKTVPLELKVLIPVLYGADMRTLEAEVRRGERNGRLRVGYLGEPLSVRDYGMSVVNCTLEEGVLLDRGSSLLLE
jgi:hypothetical protein